MTRQPKTTSQKHETQAKELTPDELEHVSGAHSGGINVALGDGSVRIGDANADGKVDAADYVVWRKSLG